MNHKFILIDSVKVHYVEVGTHGSPILLLHGWPYSWKIFQNSIYPLAHHHRVVAIDLPGFGHSEELPGKHTLASYVEFLHKLIKALGFRKVSLVGVSFGSVLAARYTSKYPRRVHALILHAIPYYWKYFVTNRMRYYDELLERLPGLKSLVIAYQKSLLNERSYIRHHPLIGQFVDEEKFHSYYEEFCLFKDRAAIETFHQLTHLDIRPQLKKIRKPTLVIAAREDNVVRLEDVYPLMEMLQNGRLTIIDDADHACVCEHPVEFAHAVENFLSEVK